MSKLPNVPVHHNDPSASVESKLDTSDVPHAKAQHVNIRPPITWSNWWKEVEWVRFIVVVIMPPFAALCAYFTKLHKATAIWSVIVYFISGLEGSCIGMTAGYHRLWSHRSYNATLTLEIILAFMSSTGVMGPIIWWARLHRAHHRYTDTELDPHNATRGLFWAHIGCVIFEPRRKHGRVELGDLLNNPVVMWQLRYYPWVAVTTGIIFPTAVAGLGWGDWQGGFIYATLLRLFVLHQSVFFINSIAHQIGDAPFDDKKSPRDYLLTSFLTFGEGYHNFHHQFPMDYRNTAKWYQYVPTKWLIWLFHKAGLASHLKKFPENEIVKGKLMMKLKQLRQTQDALAWPPPEQSLPVLNWSSYQMEAKSRAVICIAGFIHDVEDFLDVHPGGRHLLLKYVGQDATSHFYGGIYNHSNAAHNLLSMKRVGILHGGVPHVSEERAISPPEWLRIVHVKEHEASDHYSLVAD